MPPPSSTSTDTIEPPAGHSPAQTMVPVLQLDGVSKVFDATPPVIAVDDVSLSVMAGELVGVIGHSGSGKSTLLNLMGTLDRPTEGSVLLEGHDISSLSDKALSGVRAARIGFVFQQFHLMERSTALTNVADGLVYMGMPRSERLDRAEVALTRVGLSHRLDQRAAKLSGGERQRVAVARAIAADPAIVLADEPTGNLDSANSEAIVDLLVELNAAGTTMLVITHDIELADKMPRRIQLVDGRIVEDTAVTTSVPAPTSQPPAARPDGAATMTNRRHGDIQ